MSCYVFIEVYDFLSERDLLFLVLLYLCLLFFLLEPHDYILRVREHNGGLLLAVVLPLRRGAVALLAAGD